MLLCVLGVGMGSMLRASSPMDGHHPAAVSMSSSVWVIPLSPPRGVHPQVGWPATHTVLNLEHSISHTTSVTSHPPVKLKGPISPLHAAMPPSPSPSSQASLMTTLHTSLHHLCLSQQGRHPWDRVGTELPPLTFSFEALCLCQVLLRRWGLLRGPQRQHNPTVLLVQPIPGSFSLTGPGNLEGPQHHWAPSQQEDSSAPLSHGDTGDILGFSWTLPLLLLSLGWE
jgi:hypothetical protein